MSTQSSRRLLWQWLRLLRQQRSTAGFTLIELLVAVSIGSVIISTLLFGVVEILQINQRESSRSETQREMQLALDYINSDLRESVFVYDGLCLEGQAVPDCPGIKNYLPTSLRTGNNVPVLAFWRIDELPAELQTQCAQPGNLTATEAKGVPCKANRTYTLVVYLLDKSPPDATWRGRARIRRYELPQFASNGTANQGWADPTATNFTRWPFAPNGDDLRVGKALPTLTNAPVLVDFVDSDTQAAVCPKSFTPAAGNPSLPDFLPSPSNAAGTASTLRSFYACVRGGNNNATSIGNQEVALFLRGNALGRLGIRGNVFFEMETRALTRGSYEKQPSPL